MYQEHSLCREECLQDEPLPIILAGTLMAKENKKEKKQKIQKAKTNLFFACVGEHSQATTFIPHSNPNEETIGIKPCGGCSSLVLSLGNLELYSWFCFNCTAVSLNFGFCK